MTTPTPVVAPYVPTYATRQPYLSVAEFLAAPTGVDLSQLAPGQDEATNQAALETVLASASSYADTICEQVLAATLDTQVGEYRVFRDGTIRVPVDYTPLIAVTGVQIGWAAGQLTALPSLAGLYIKRKTVRIPVALSPASIVQWGPTPLASAATGYVLAQVTYVNGYANTELETAAVSGASTLTVTNPLGIFPGLPLTVIDDAEGNTEIVTVAPTYIVGSPAVPLASPLVNPHAAGVTVSAMPRAIKQAVICLAAHLIKTRGSESLAMASMTGGPAVEKDAAGYGDEYQQAVDLLHPFRRVA